MSELDDLFRGLVFYGTGGGGRAAPGTAMLRQHFGRGWIPCFASVEDLPGDTLACATIVIGGRDPEDDVGAGERQRLALPAEDRVLADRFAAAILALGRLEGRPVGAIAVVELGSMAMAASLIAADLLGIPVLDSDGTGRSIPELGLAKLDLAGISPAPLALVDRFGGETLLNGVASAAMADRTARQISRAVWGRGLACAAYAQPLAEFSKGLVRASVRTAWDVGTILGRHDSVEARLDALFARIGGRIVCRGRLVGQEWRSREPYAFREFNYLLEGEFADAGDSLRVFVKNEHHLVWRGDVPIASGPAPIALLDADTLEPLTTLGDVAVGQSVIVVTTPSLDPAWNSAAGARLLGPTAFGFDFEVPSRQVTID